MVVINEEEYLAHYGTPRHSGRYPWGSGGNEVPQHSMTFFDTIDDLRRKGLSDTEIARGMGISSTQFRAKRSIANAEIKLAQIARAQALKDKGNSTLGISKRMGIPEPTVRTLLEPGAKDKAETNTATATMLKKEVDSKKYLDIGSGAELSINNGVSPQRLNVAVEMLKLQGYKTHEVKTLQQGTGLNTTRKILVPPGVDQREVFLNQDKIKQITSFSEDGGRRYGQIHDPISINPNRVSVRYKEDGGDTADGMIYVRPGVDDISLGKNMYAQVRIQVGSGHYLKGMAIYKKDLPSGTDLMFNTNKSSTGNKLDAMKPLESDKDYPFGSIVRQITADTGTPNERVTSAMNLVNEQGDWHKWQKNLSSQILSKQSPTLAKGQLNVTYERRQKEFDEINALTNPTVKKKLLESFADETDAAAVHLKAAALPKSNWHAILPIDSIPPTQIYAPNYRDGEPVVLIRYPHGGTFEIPELIVNNRNREAKQIIGPESEDAVGIHHSVAKRLSGADFDGDTVLVIPNRSGKIKTSSALSELKDFDPMQYKIPDDSPIPKISPSRKQQEMGKISNLITDMTLKAAPHSEIVRAVKHSMVVIDSEKHHLNYRLSAERNGISALKAKYQGGPRSGAATLISRKKATVNLPELKDRPHKEGGPIDVATGRKVLVPSGATRRDREGNVIEKKKRYVQLALTEDAHTLSSGTIMERLYAEHSNKLKALANQARVARINTPLLKYEPSAKKAYAKEVASLESKLRLVIRNRPLERQAQDLARASIKAKFAANPNLEEASKKKIRWKEQEIARTRTGAKHQDIKITDDEWNAIQAGAISDHKLSQILAKSDLDLVRKHATPRREHKMTSSKTARAKQMLALGYTRADIADALGVSLTTLDIATHG